ncbi:hypothetical protein KA005_15285 [bacterium]|nr:hypothetical protein [bacterium]
MTFRYKKAFLKRFNHSSAQEKELIIDADGQIRHYYTTQFASYGLRVKKLYDNGKDKIFEARVSDKIRIVWVESKELISFAIVGSHDEVRRYIKTFRQP